MDQFLDFANFRKLEIFVKEYGYKEGNETIVFETCRVVDTRTV